MSRLIVIPHTGGLIDYKGEDVNLFSDIVTSTAKGLVVEYFGKKGKTVWADYVDPRPVINITSITCSDPSFFYDAAAGFIAVKANVAMTIIATISNFKTAAKWNTPIHRNGQLEGYLATAADATGGVVFTANFPQMGAWELSNEIINAGVPEDAQFILQQNLKIKVSA